MAFESRLTALLNKKKWIIPLLFAFMCFYAVATILATELKLAFGSSPLDPKFAFSIGGEVCATIVAIMMTISLLPSYKRQGSYTRIFVTLLTAGCSLMFFDSMQMLIDGEADFALMNKILSICVFSVESFFVFFFWVYATYALKNDSKTTDIFNYVLSALCVIFVLIPFVNLFYPLYFTIDEFGIYHRNHDTWWICRIFMILVAICVIISIFLSKESRKTKLVISVFMGLPFAAIAGGGFQYGLSITYTTMMVSLVLIYVMQFSDTERDLYSTNRELGLATNIQKNMLPSIFPAFPDRKEFDIYALMSPAKEVGGDFYDFFLIDDTHLGIVMADVSDKGVPAALFMMASKIMIQNFTLLGQSPKQVLESANKQICMNNQLEMFVTVWLGILDLKTGIITATNAGHEKPIIKQPGKDFEILNDKHGFVVGGFASTKYSEYEIKLEKGAKLFLYTDGVPEATSSEGQFGMERTVETLNKLQAEDPSNLVKHMKETLDQYVGNNDQFDDITMLCLEFKGCDSDIISYEFPAEVNNIDAMLDPIISKLEAMNVEHKTVHQIHLSLEELFANVANYAYYPDKGNIHIEFEIKKDPKELVVKIVDEGKPFNPLESEEPDFTTSVQDRKIGGLGLFIVKKTMDDIKYVRDGNKNVLVIKKKL